MEPVGGITRGLFRVGVGKDVITGTYCGTYWVSLRPCPVCGKKLFANGKKFLCSECGYEKEYTVKKKRKKRN